MKRKKNSFAVPIFSGLPVSTVMYNLVSDFQCCFKGKGVAAMSTLCFKPGALLNEAHEWGNACAGSNHDDWVAGLEG